MAPLTLDQALELAEQALEAGELEDALTYSTQALALAPNDPDALELKALAQAELGDFEAADETFAQLLALRPKHTVALIEAADVKIRQPGDDRERIAEGLRLLERAEPLAAQDEALSQELWLLRGIASNQLGELETALDAFARVLDLDPEHGEARLEQAVALFELGRFDQAKKAFATLTRDFPEEAWPFHYLGLIAERAGDPAAPGLFERARSLDPVEFPHPIVLSAEAFDRAVSRAVDSLPEHAKPHLSNVVLTVEPLPSAQELKEGLSPTILGVFQGTPVTERLDTVSEHHQTARITLFQKNLERFARSEAELIEEIRITVLHEVGHLLGLDEAELYERGLD